jgi:hypothetical protein
MERLDIQALRVKMCATKNCAAKVKEKTMAKKVLVLMVLAAAAAGGVFAQEKTANVKQSWISGEASVIGAGSRYEFMISEKLSVGMNVYWTWIYALSDFGVNAALRLYPWGKTFFAELGLGYGMHSALRTFTTTIEAYGYSASTKWDAITFMEGFDMAPGIGWKIDVGNPGGFFISPSAQLILTFGEWRYSAVAGDLKDESGVGVGFRTAFGLGWAF